MCGICGIVSDRPEPVDLAVLERMAGVLRHRGPDDSGAGAWRQGDLHVGFGFRRLSIVDLTAAGHQPMTNEDETVWLVFNGEIYNHAEIRRELIERGHTYRSRTDSETILHAYEEWGDACVDRFRGMFAFAIGDLRNRRVLLARDRLGIKPLYYAVGNGTLVFGSEIKAILESRVVQARPAPGAVPEYLLFGLLAGDGTLFDGIRKLQPGHRLVWQDGRADVQRYWNVRFAPDASLTEERAAQRVRELLEESVELRLMSDVPLGVFLSGGLDSSAIAAIMSRLVPERLKTFSVGYDHKYSELPYARQVADAIGSDHREVILTADAFLESLPRMIWHEDEPIWAPPSIALYHVARLASESVTVVLTGEGSDELFAGYDRYWMTRYNLRAAALYSWLPGVVRRGVRSAVIDGPLPERIRRALSHSPINRDRVPHSMIFDNWLGVFTPAMQRAIGTDGLVRELDATDVYAAHAALYEESGAADPVDRMLYSDIKSNMVELLMKQDQMSMAASLESRVPFLDHKLVEFAATIPVGMKLAPFSGKRILKRALNGLVPEAIINRPKKGFPIPFDGWLRHRFMGHVEAALLDDRAAARGWFKPDAVREMVEGHRTGRINATRQLWTLWNLELWARIFVDGERHLSYAADEPAAALAGARTSGATRDASLDLPRNERHLA